MVSAAGFGPATHALKESPNQFELTTCMSSYLHPWQNNINEIQNRASVWVSGGCPESGLSNNITAVSWILLYAKESFRRTPPAFGFCRD